MMKSMKQITILTVLMLMAMTQVQAGYAFAEEDEAIDTIRYNVYTGTVIDAESNDPLPFATVEGVGGSIATVTNIEGEFTLKVPKTATIKEIKVTYVGYKNTTAGIQEYRNTDNNMIRLQPTSVNLQEVTIRAEDATYLISEILKNINENYSNTDMMMTAFYREAIKKRRNYVSISEAVVDIYKAPYANSFRYDQVKLIQGRKSADVEKMDTILFKVQGGPVTTLLLDVVKNPYILLSENYTKVYNFYITGVISLNDRLHYIVSFNQKPYVTTPFYNGKFYVDMEKLAISEAEFELNMENEAEVAEMFIRKKPYGVNVIPEKAAYRAKYTITDDTWYFNYARAEVKFDVKWDRKLFKTQYFTMSEIAITDRGERAPERIPMKERFKKSEVLDELVYVFFDQDFWGSYNVIEPDQSIEDAIEKLNRKFMKNAESNPAP